KYMSRSAKFHELLRAEVVNPPARKLQLLHVRGLGHKTKELAKMEPKKDRVDYSFGKAGEVDGDGTVTAKSGAPLAFFKALDFTSIDTGLGHLDVLAKPEAQIFIQDFLKK
ncbi:MAG: hypothetical protein K2Q18_05720, partial [Bdellovibrionales bacterium]|nr:hypothetical protein [Bdellovibrionales bacterium]